MQQGLHVRVLEVFSDQSRREKNIDVKKLHYFCSITVKYLCKHQLYACNYCK